MDKRFNRAKYGLSVAHLDSDARSIDWAGDDDFFMPEHYEMHLPAPTYGDWQELDSDAPKRRASRELEDEDLAAFEETSACSEWRDGFAPMMNYAWPVSLAYGVDLEDAVALIAKYAPACTLISFDDEAEDRFFGGDAPEYVIALSGGGMDLSDHIAAAYLACGCVPPMRILEALPGRLDEAKAKRIPLRAAYREAAKQFAWKAKRAREDAKRLFSRKV